MDLGLALHAGGDLSCGVEFLIEGGGLDGLEGGDQGLFVLIGGVSWEEKVGWVACGVGYHFPNVLVGVHDDCGSSFVCWYDGDVWDFAEVFEGVHFVCGEVGGLVFGVFEGVVDGVA